MTHQPGNDDKRATPIVHVAPHYPTQDKRELVQHLTACGLDVVQIAKALRCSQDDVHKHYQNEMDNAVQLVNARVMANVLHNALYKDDMQAAKLWLINRAGWRGGDNNKIGVGVQVNALTGQPMGEGEAGLTVVQRREVITTLLSKVTQTKRRNEQPAIEGEFTEAPRKNGVNGGNGTKHK